MPARGPSRPLSRMVSSWVAALQLTNGGVVDAVVPCGPRGNSSTAWVQLTIGAHVGWSAGRLRQCGDTALGDI